MIRSALLQMGVLLATVRIDPDKAARLIARHLRDFGLSPHDANALATKIIENLKAAGTSRTKPGLKHWKLIPPSPPELAVSRIMQNKKFQLDQNDIHFIWNLLYQQGIDPPDDIDMTNR
jgi:hypothetical protein